MRILFLGNSFTFCNSLPVIVEKMLGAQVASHTRGGAWLAEQLNPETEMGARTLKALREQKWDYVVLQEQSFGPVGSRESFLKSARKLCKIIRASGAVPVFYATWAYREGSEKLAATSLTYEQMDAALYESYHEAAGQSGALVADVGRSFTALRDTIKLYGPDDYHPTEAASVLAASVIANTIRAHQRNL